MSRNSRTNAGEMGFIFLIALSAALLLSTASACGYPGSPAHASVAFSSEVVGPGAVATYTCDTGFELLGPGRRVCSANGTWIPPGIPFCVINVAVGKAPMQSSLAGKGIPQKAIDGSTSTFFNPDTCTMTKPERSSWWYVNLLEPYMVQLVRLDFGTSCCSNKRPATIVVRVGNNRPDLDVNPICSKYTGTIEEGRPLFLPCVTAMPGAFVSVYLEDPPSNPLSICEAFVYTDQALPIERCPTFRDQPLGSTATYNGKCYTFYNSQPRNLLSARRFCEIRGGNLIDETSPALQGFLSWELFRRHRNDPDGQYWLGAVRDAKDPKNWKWINGQDVTVSFWNKVGTKENCSRFDGSRGWLWSETNCNLNLNFICQHKPATCGKPERPANSTIIAKNFDIGSVIEYRCNPGHLLVGPNLRTCLPSGFFSEFPPNCRYLECGPPALIANGQFRLLNGTRHYLSVVEYTCDEGHVLVGRGTLVCDVDEKWNGPPPRCEPFYCRKPAPVANGYFVMSSNSTVFGTVARYYCHEGFQLKGKEQLTCVASGYWDGEPPLCIRDDLGKSTIINNGLDKNVAASNANPVLPSPTSLSPSASLQDKHLLPSFSSSPGLTSSSTLKPEQGSYGTRLVTSSVQTSEATTNVAFTQTNSPPSSSLPPVLHGTNADESFVYLDESPTNQIPQYKEAPSKTLNLPPDKKQPAIESGSTKPQDSTSQTSPGTIKYSQDTPVMVLNPKENEIPHLHRNEKPVVKYGLKNDGKMLSNAQAKLNMGGIIALGVFGGFILLAITVTLILIFVRRTFQDSRRSLAAPTVTTYDGSSGVGETGLHKFYKKAWDNLRYDGKASILPCSMDRSTPGTCRDLFDNVKGPMEGFREASEIFVNDITALYARPERNDGLTFQDDSPSSEKRAIREWYSQQLGQHSRKGAS